MTICREINRRTIAIVALEGLATSALPTDPHVAQNHYLEMQDLATELAMPQQLVTCLAGLGDVALELGDLERASSYYQRNLELVQAQGYDWLQSTVMIRLAKVARAKGAWPQARKHFRQAFDEAYRSQRVGTLLWGLFELAELLYRKEEEPEMMLAILRLLATHPRAIHGHRQTANERLAALDESIAGTPAPDLSELVAELLTGYLAEANG